METPLIKKARQKGWEDRLVRRKTGMLPSMKTLTHYPTPGKGTPNGWLAFALGIKYASRKANRK